MREVGPFAGTTVFVRTFLRRDRWMILWFTLGITLLYWSQAASVRGLYRTQAELDAAARSMQSNPAFVAMAGPARALNTIGGQVTWQASAIGAVVIGLMAMFLIGRHTRAEEESGRDELVRASVVGRHAPTTAALVVVVLSSLLVGAAVALSLIAYDLHTTGAISLGVGLVLLGTTFAGVALVAAQLTSSVRATYGLTGAVIGVSWGLRAIGDVGNGALSWCSPIGWYQAMHAYSGERWWPALLLVAATVALVVAAYSLFSHRDIGAGLWPDRPGPARAAAGLTTSVGLAWRLQRGSVLGWATGMLLGGLAYGSIGQNIDSLMGDSDFAHDVFGAGGPDVVDVFYAVAALLLVLIGSGFTISSALRPRSEEDAHRVEDLLATGLSRRSWLVGHVVVTLIGTLVICLAGGLGLSAGFSLVTGSADRLWPFTAAALSLLPGALLLGALGWACFGLAPRLAGVAWLGLAFCVVVMMFGTPLQIPAAVQDFSPFHHFARYPAVGVDWIWFGVVTVIAAVLGAAGLVGFGRRDVH